MEDILVRELRRKVGEEIPKVLPQATKVSRDEALMEAEYLLKRRLMETMPTTLEEAKRILEDTFKMIYAYFKSLNYDIPPEELLSYLKRG